MNAYRTGMLIGMPTTQIAIRLENSLLNKVDDLVASGAMDNRAEVVRTALSLLLQQREQERIDRLIVDGYTSSPSTPAEDAAAEASLRAAILDEPW